MSIPWEAIITIVLFMIVHLAGTVWWMSKLQTTVENMSKSLDKMSDAVSKAWNKDDALREIGRIESIANAAHRRIDGLNGHKRSST